MVTAEELRNLLSYNVATGDFYWLRTNSNRAQKGAKAGGCDKLGRRVVRINRRGYFAHRLAWLWMTGEWPSEVIDHKDGNPSNNSWSNLREATQAQNLANSRPKRINLLGVKGVRYQCGKYEANITIDGKQVYLGRYRTVEEAQRAYMIAAVRRHGEFARAG